MSDLCSLKQRQQTSLLLCDNKIKQWTAFCNEYKTLKEKLSTITERTRHSVMIPVVHSNGNRPPISLVPGIIQHTNEIMVLLGDNWFVERSAKEAIEIVNRRLRKCEGMLIKLNQEKKQVLSWINFTEKVIEEKNDFVEIVEEFDEKEELKWREEHKRKVKEFKQKEAVLRMNQIENDESSFQDINKQSNDLEVLNKETNVEERVFPFKSILKNKNNEKMIKSSTISDTESGECSNECDDVSTFSTAKSIFQKSDRQTEDNVPKRAEKPFTGQIIERTQQKAAKQKTEPSIVSKFKKERKK